MQLSPQAHFRTFPPAPESLHACGLSITAPSLGTRQEPVCFLPLWVCLFWKFQVNRIIQYIVFCVWLPSLSIILLRFTLVVTCDSSLFLLIAELYSIGWIYHSLFIHCLVDGHLDCFQFGAIVNHAAVTLPVQTFVWTYVFFARF